jgi:hypothetical protein
MVPNEGKRQSDDFAPRKESGELQVMEVGEAEPVPSPALSPSKMDDNYKMMKQAEEDGEVLDADGNVVEEETAKDSFCASIQQSLMYFMAL